MKTETLGAALQTEGQATVTAITMEPLGQYLQGKGYLVQCVPALALLYLLVHSSCPLVFTIGDNLWPEILAFDRLHMMFLL